jgi:hypothetical protein
MGSATNETAHLWRFVRESEYHNAIVVVLTLVLVATPILLVSTSVCLQVSASSTTAILNSYSPLSYSASNKADLNMRNCWCCSLSTDLFISMTGHESHYNKYLCCIYCFTASPVANAGTNTVEQDISTTERYSCCSMVGRPSTTDTSST